MQVGGKAAPGGTTTVIEGSFTIQKNSTSYTCEFKFCSNEDGYFNVSPSGGNIVGYNAGGTEGPPKANIPTYIIAIKN